MRVLLAHSFYGAAAPSGENEVFEAERALLARNGHSVAALLAHGDDYRRRGVAGLVAGGLATPWNPFAARRVHDAVQAFAPDVVHVHNTFPGLSPAIFRAVPSEVPRVLTLHNYRLFCAAGIPLRDGVPCTECLDRRCAAPSLKQGCYRGSRLATAPLAVSVALHRWLRTWDDHVDAFVALTEFQRSTMVAAGLPEERVLVKPNFVDAPGSVVPWDQRGNYAVFAGRLSEEKGADALVRAWAAWGDDAPELRILGDGSQRRVLQAMARGGSAVRVVFHGQVSPEEVGRQVAAAKLVVVPSRWFEGLPRVVPEAFARGTPVAASDLGSLATLVQDGVNGVRFPHSDPAALLARVRAAWEAAGELERLGAGARASFETTYTAEANHRLLLGVYDSARAAASRRAPARRSGGCPVDATHRDEVVTIVEGCDFDSFPTGGVVPFLRNCLEHAPADARIRLVGLTTSRDEPVGTWTVRRIGDRSFPFLPVAYCPRSSTEKPSIVPNRAWMLAGLSRHAREVADGSAVIYVHSPELALPFTVVGRSKRLVLHLHGIAEYVSLNSRYAWARRRPASDLYNASVGAVLRRADKLICVSEDGYRRLAPNAAAQRKAIVIPTSVDVRRFRRTDAGDARAEHHIPADLKLVGFLGRLNNHKRPDLLLEAFSRLAAKRSDVGLVFMGDGELRPSLEQAAARSGFGDRVFFLGKIAHDRLPQCLNTLAVGCLPSKAGEGFPLTVLEFLACGVPVVASNVADLAAIVRDGETGFLVAEDAGPEALAERLDAALRGGEGMRAACVAVAGDYSAEKVGRTVFDALGAA